MYTFRLEPQVIRMHEDGARVVQENCIRCHAPLFSGLDKTKAAGDRSLRMHDTERLCWSCHRETPHGRASSLSATPNVKTPGLESAGSRMGRRVPASSAGSGRYERRGALFIVSREKFARRDCP